MHSGERWCVPPIVRDVVMVDDNIYEGLSPIGNLKTNDRVGLGVIICYVGLMIYSPLWGGIQ